jgi:long-chain acyl-CoA synthetase
MLYFFPEPMSVSSQVQTVTGALSHWAAARPEKMFIHSAHGSFSFAESNSIALRLAGFLSANGVQAGARICLLLPRRPELAFSFFAANFARCLPVPVNYLETPESVKSTLALLAPAVIIVDESVVSKDILNFLKKCGALVVSAGGGTEEPHSFVRWNDCLQHNPLSELPEISPEDAAYLNFTSGSSGQPKGAVCTHANIYWNTSSAIEVFDLREEDVHLCMFAAFAHPHELFSRALYTGGSLVLLPEISPKAIVRAVKQYHVTCMMGLAVMHKMLAEHCADTLPTLRIAESGGMFTPSALQENFFAAFHVPLLPVWGSTETTGIALANAPACRRTDGAMGKPCPHYQVKLADEQGCEVRQGEIGELLISGPAVVSAYWENMPFPGQNGWYCSGDLAWQDSDGFYHFVERKNGMIKVAGLKVYPLQIEQALLRHPGISEAAVVGMKERRHGSVPQAFVVPQAGAQLETDELIQFCRQHLASYMVPRQFIFLAALPKTGGGKINKKALPLESCQTL